MSFIIPARSKNTTPSAIQTAGSLKSNKVSALPASGTGASEGKGALQLPAEAVENQIDIARAKTVANISNSPADPSCEGLR